MGNSFEIPPKIISLPARSNNKLKNIAWMTNDEKHTYVVDTLEKHAQKGAALLKDLKFFHAGELPKYLTHCMRYESRCETCKQLVSQIVELSEKADLYLDGTISGRKQFELSLDSIVKHLKQTHHLQPKGYIQSTFAVIGIVVGGVLGYLLALWINPNGIRLLVPVVSFIGMSTGIIGGKIKEHKIAKQQGFL